METTNKSQGITVYFEVPHLGSKLRFFSPAKGPENYIAVAGKLKQDYMLQPTMAENASLVHMAWQKPEEKYSKEIIDNLRENWLWCFNGILYEPNEGAYIQDNPEIRDGKVFMDKKDLTEKLKANDPSVRFVEFGYKIGEQNAKELERNPFVIALAGEEGAKKLAEVSTNYKFKPVLFSFENVKEPAIRVASLDDYGNWLSDRLVVVGNDFIDYWERLAFGLSRSREAA